MFETVVSLETFSARQIESIIGLRRKTEKSQPEGQRIMSETRFTEFPALSVDPRVGISRSALETDS